MSGGLLLDEMYPPLLADELIARGHDVTSVVTDKAHKGAPDDVILSWATESSRCLLTENVTDFEALRIQWLESGRTSAGLLYTHRSRYPRHRSLVGRLTKALDERLTQQRLPVPGQVDWLS